MASLRFIQKEHGMKIFLTSAVLLAFGAMNGMEKANENQTKLTLQCADCLSSNALDYISLLEAIKFGGLEYNSQGSNYRLDHVVVGKKSSCTRQDVAVVIESLYARLRAIASGESSFLLDKVSKMKTLSFEKAVHAYGALLHDKNIVNLALEIFLLHMFPVIPPNAKARLDVFKAHNSKKFNKLFGSNDPVGAISYINCRALALQELVVLIREGSSEKGVDHTFLSRLDNANKKLREFYFPSFASTLRNLKRKFDKSADEFAQHIVQHDVSDDVQEWISFLAAIQKKELNSVDGKLRFKHIIDSEKQYEVAAQDKIHRLKELFTSNKHFKGVDNFLSIAKINANGSVKICWPGGSTERPSDKLQYLLNWLPVEAIEQLQEKLILNSVNSFDDICVAMSQATNTNASAEKSPDLISYLQALLKEKASIKYQCLDNFVNNRNKAIAGDSLVRIDAKIDDLSKSRLSNFKGYQSK